MDDLVTMCGEAYSVEMSLEKEWIPFAVPKRNKGWFLEAKALTSNHE